MNRLDTKCPWGTEKGRQKPLHPTPPTHTQGLWVKCPGSAGGGEKTLEAPPPSPTGRWGGPGARQASARPHSTGLSQGGCDPCPAPSPPPRLPLIGPNNFTLWSPDGACFGCPSGPSSPTPGCITGRYPLTLPDACQRGPNGGHSGRTSLQCSLRAKRGVGSPVAAPDPVGRLVAVDRAPSSGGQEQSPLSRVGLHGWQRVVGLPPPTDCISVPRHPWPCQHSGPLVKRQLWGGSRSWKCSVFCLVS